ncbi:MAG: hypothetical protein EOO59_00275 [Hymenobacter sp.]|nr:MAG: hypothetical protein EOO59_00275 [Hymenobacter sp.]
MAFPALSSPSIHTRTVTAANTSATADPTAGNNNGTAPAAILSVAVLPIGPAGTASACATPGRDGSPTITASPNTYYPATDQTVAAGATSLSVGAAVGTTPIAAGDLLLVIQMQGADIDYSNTDTYGDGVAGCAATGYLSNAEYVVAAGAVGGGTVTTTAGLKNGYQNASATTTTGQRRFQVVRIPQYQTLTISGTVAPAAWNGSTGGILALDVSGQLAFATGAKLDASDKGFWGGAGQQLRGTTSTSFTATDYRATAPTSGTTTTGAHAMKGEGIVGTPRYVNNGTALLDTGVEGYPSGTAGITNSQVSNSVAGSASGINCSVDVTTTISAPSAATVGQTVSLPAVFANNGGVAAATVARTVTLASGAVNNPVTSVTASGSSSISSPDPTTGAVTITYPALASLAANTSNTFGISYVAPGTASVVATSAITTTSTEPVTDNNTATATTTINGYADVVTAVFDLNNSTTGRATATYAAVFVNNGPAAAASVTRTVTLPAGATLTTA